MHKLNLYFLFILLISPAIINAQEGWHKGELISNSGTTKSGYVKIAKFGMANKEFVKFKTGKKAKVEEIEASSVKKLIFVDQKSGEKSEFEFVELFEDKVCCMRVVVRGKVTLYARKKRINLVGAPTTAGAGTGPTGAMPVGMWGPYSFGNFNEYFAHRTGEDLPTPLIQVSVSKPFKKKGAEYFKDCPSLKNKIESKEYKKKDIKEAVEYYNEKC